MKFFFKQNKITISSTLIFLLLVIVVIVLFGGIFTINSIKTYVGNDAYVINELGKIRGSIQRMSKLMLAKRNYSEVVKTIENDLNAIDNKYLTQKLTLKYQNKVNFIKEYNKLKDCWFELKNIKNLNVDEIISISEKCWVLANNATTAAEKIAEIKKNALINSVRVIIIVIIFFIIILILIIFFMIKKGIEKDRITDKLTNLFNRFYLEEQLNYYIELNKRYGRKFSIIILDIDFFKQINDTYGHEKGDEVLFEVAEIIRKEIRNVDLAFRYGGEEFVILLPETNLEEAVKIAERLKKAIENNKFSVNRKITVSIGVAEYKKGENIKDLIIRADKNLYKAKKSGRNMVVWN